MPRQIQVPNAAIVNDYQDVRNAYPLPVQEVGASNEQTPVVNAATGAAAAIAATLAAVAAKTNWLSGFTVTGAGATAASVISVTVTGILGGTITYIMAIPAGATVAVTPLNVTFPKPIPASAVNTAIAVNVPSFGAGNTNAAVVAHGFVA